MRVLALLLLLSAVACGHSEPFVTADQEIAGPFAAGEPLRLTWSPTRDRDPSPSADGHWLAYQFERGRPDGDRCLGLLPSAGGQRQYELCAWSVDEDGSADALAHGAVRSDSVIAFTLHSGNVGSMTSLRAGLYLGPVDSIAGSRLVLPLMQQVPGSSGVWTDLVDPVWIGPTELQGLAARRLVVNTSPCGVCPPPRDSDRTAYKDTLFLGLEIVRLDVSAATAVIRGSIPAAEAIGWSRDPSSGTVHFIVQRAASDDETIRHESVADTLMVSVGGGPATPLYGVPVASSGRVLERLHGVTSGQGRVFVSRSWRTPAAAPLPTVPPGTPLISNIAEVLPDGSLQEIAHSITWRWGKLQISPDGKYLYAEALERGGIGDIYRIAIP